MASAVRSIACAVVVALVTVASLAAWPHPTAAQDPDAAAKAKFDLGRQHYEAGRFLDAAAAFEEAYRISQRSALLYNLYLAYRDGNDTQRAAVALRSYLEKTKDGVENRPLLEAKLAAMEQSLRPVPAVPPAPATPPPPAATGAPAPREAPPPTEPGPAEASEPSGPEKNNLVPAILIGTGGAMVVGGIVTGFMTSSAQSDLEDACPDRANCTVDLADTHSRGETLALVTDILLFGGIAVAGTGVVLFLLGDSKETASSTPAASLACIPGACGASVRGAF